VVCARNLDKEIGSFIKAFQILSWSSIFE